MSKTANATVKTARASRKSKKTENKPAVETQALTLSEVEALNAVEEANVQAAQQAITEAREFGAYFAREAFDQRNAYEDAREAYEQNLRDTMVERGHPGDVVSDAAVAAFNEEADKLFVATSFPVALIAGETSVRTETERDVISVDQVLTDEEHAALVQALESQSKPADDAPTFTSEPAQPASEETAPATITGSALIINALKAREQVSDDITTAVSGIARAPSALNALYLRAEWAPVLDSLADRIKISDKGNKQFIAVKTAVKLVHAAEAIAQGMQAAFDPYSRIILRNLANQLADEGMTMRSMQVSLSRKVTYGPLDKQQTLTHRYDCSPGTASTQASSTRMMLEAFGLCVVTKGARDDTVTWADNDRAYQVRALFKV